MCAYALERSFPNASIIIREHPSCPISQLQSDSNISISAQTFLDDLQQCDVVISSCSTTAALEAYLCYKHVLIFLEYDSLHYGPLRSINHPYLARNNFEIISFVRMFCLGQGIQDQVIDYLRFNSTSDLRFWCEFIYSLIWFDCYVDLEWFGFYLLQTNYTKSHVLFCFNS